MVLYEDEQGQLWVRAFEEFTGTVTVEVNGQTQVVRRYRPIGLERQESL